MQFLMQCPGGPCSPICQSTSLDGPFRNSFVSYGHRSSYPHRRREYPRHELICKCGGVPDENMRHVGGSAETSAEPNLMPGKIMGCLAAAAMALCNTSVADAYNVRVEDVENPAMQAGWPHSPPVVTDCIST